jgi:hypothetical protein
MVETQQGNIYRSSGRISMSRLRLLAAEGLDIGVAHYIRVWLVSRKCMLPVFSSFWKGPAFIVEYYTPS